MSPSSPRYASVQILLHWLIFFLFAFNYIVSDDMGKALRVKLDGGTPDIFAALVHPPVGFAILVLTLLRLLARARYKAPPLPEGNHPLLNRAAHIVHRSLYALLVLVPVSGIAAWGIGIRTAGDVHEVLVNLTLAIVVLHAGAAIYHQFYLKDGLLNRMRPSRGD
ncbi:cytochrome b [Celeribacter arenosi]|uniref:Cytochrome b561 n=1 Tax=Celeribacter arenosi TaxID=792649 RepID=A0ABP7K5N8_9RHOB